MSEIELLARKVLYTEHEGVCPICGSSLDELARCTNQARHEPALEESEN